LVRDYERRNIIAIPLGKVEKAIAKSETKCLTMREIATIFEEDPEKEISDSLIKAVEQLVQNNKVKPVMAARNGIPVLAYQIQGQRRSKRDELFSQEAEDREIKELEDS